MKEALLEYHRAEAAAMAKVARGFQDSVLTLSLSAYAQTRSDFHVNAVLWLETQTMPAPPSHLSVLSGKTNS